MAGKLLPMSRIEREKKTIDIMLAIYCHDHHQASDGLCDNCSSLKIYAHQRLDVCPFHENKPACNKCAVHCYSEKMRARVKNVMRYSEPRMMFRHPLLALMHALDLFRKAPKLKSRQ